jgi:hypothetical protein
VPPRSKPTQYFLFALADIGSSIVLWVLAD